MEVSSGKSFPQPIAHHVLSNAIILLLLKDAKPIETVTSFGKSICNASYGDSLFNSTFDTLLKQ